MEDLSFYVTAAVVLAMATTVVVARTPMRAALALIVTLAAQAALYLQLDAPFVAAMQVLVYAGAIMVLFLFVIMLLNAGKEPFLASWLRAPLRVAGVLALVVFAFMQVRQALTGVWPVRAVDGSVAHVGRLLLVEHAVAFEAVSVVLLVAVLGSIVLGLRRLA